MTGSAAGFERCALCGAGDLETFLDLASVPVNCSAFTPSAEEARTMPTGRLRLAYCPSCGFVQNTAFDPDLPAYGDDYDNSLNFSSTFLAYQDRLVEEIIDRWGLSKGRVVEIGCGNAEFLTLLCERSGSRGVGYDPSFSGTLDPDGPVEVHARYFAQTDELPGADLICCRHVLEHLPSPAGLARSLRAATGPATGLYVEVPNAAHLFGSDDIWDLIYPHCGYYSADSLTRVFTDAGLVVEEVTESFGGQFLSLYGSGAQAASGYGAAGGHRAAGGPGGAGGAHDRSGLAESVTGFAGRLAERASTWTARLAGWRREGLTSALWGAGARAVTFLNVVEGASAIDVVVDSNPRKAGMHVPGTGQAVVGPGDPVVARADRVIVMNPMYAKEITDRLRAMGSSAEVVVV